MHLLVKSDIPIDEFPIEIVKFKGWTYENSLRAWSRDARLSYLYCSKLLIILANMIRLGLISLRA